MQSEGSCGSQPFAVEQMNISVVIDTMTIQRLSKEEGASALPELIKAYSEG